ncbi:MAG TPA: hypothetical protein VFU14_09980 [Acidimicrobiales bacterium]|nr:hypothetical protein [Acidimicrobiales bacterium]
MDTLTPTKDTGAATKASAVVYAEPDRVVTDQDLAAQIGLDGVNGAFVADLLSACLTHERCGTHLYRSVAGRTANPILRARYEEFGRETMRHVEILEQVIVTAGGNPSYVSPLARATETADTKALEATFLGSGALDPMTAEMAMLDAVLLAETVDHANWEALELLAERLPNGLLRDALRDAVAEVQEQEDEHLGWARDMRARMTMLQVSSSLLTQAQAKGEELVAQVRGWFSGDSSLDEPIRRAAEQAPRGRSAKRPAKKKATSKRSAAKKATKKKATKKKAAAKKAVTKKKAAAKKASATKKASTTKRATKKAASKKKASATKKKATSKRSTAKKSAKKASATKKKAAAKKASAKKASTSRKKAAAKKTGASRKKAASKRSAAKKKAPAKRAAKR